MHAHASHPIASHQQDRHSWWGMPWSVVVSAAIGLALAIPQPAQAKTFYCSAGDVSCLIAAINEANAKGKKNTIRLEAGTYPLTTVDNTTDGANSLPSITSALTIRGAGADQTILERHVNAPQFRLVHVAATGTLTLHALTIRGGHCASTSCIRGAGLFNQHGTIILKQTTVAENRAGPGAAGLVMNGGTAIIADSTIVDNIGDNSSEGGGLANFGGQVHIVRSLIIGNGAFHEGGGLHQDGGAMTIRQTTISGNTADTTGGLFIRSGTVTITNSAIVDNHGGLSGANGIFNMGALTITNSTIAHNHGVGFLGGGALLVNGGTTRIRNATIAENSVDTSNTRGGGILTLQGTVELQNTILAHNMVGPFGRGPDCLGPVVSLGHNLIGDPTGCTITLQPTDLAGDPDHGPLDPGLSSFTDTGLPGEAYFPLLSTSPAIDAGNKGACPKRDQLGERRHKPCDIGAIEFQGEAVASQ
jgi:hypothetical protein